MRSIALLSVLALGLFTQWGFCGESWFGQETEKLHTLSIKGAPGTISVYCPDFELGQRKMSVNSRPLELKLKSGNYRFIFSKPLYEVVTRDIRVTDENKSLAVDLPKRQTLVSQRYLVLKVPAIFHSPHRQSAVIQYKGENIPVDEGYVSRDGVFRVLAVEECLVRVQTLIDGQIKTFFF